MHKTPMAVSVIGAAALALFVSQQIGRTAPVLTALDYVEIEQLYARYAAGVDAVPDDGHMWASTFTEDGAFESTSVNDESVPFKLQGYDELKAWVSKDTTAVRRGIRSPRHYTTNILIEPASEGEMGSAYYLIMTDAEEGSNPVVYAKGVYHDQLVKTAEGWRFKKRIGTWHRFGDELLAAWAQ